MRSSAVSLTSGSITKGIISFSIPILISNLFQQLYNSIDTAVVGTFAGQTALAAVGSTGSLINLLIGFFLGIATGAGVLYAMYYGSDDHESLKKLIDTALILGVICGVFISVIGIVFAKQFLLMMDCPEDVIPEAAQYLRVYLAGTVITIIYNISAGMIRSEGDSTRPLIYLVISGVSNLILDLLFVAVFKMGVVGAALATVLAQTIAAVLTVRRLMKLDERYRLRLKSIRLDKFMCMKLVRVSVPCGIQGSMFSISNLLIQAKINSFGSIAMAGIAAYSRIDGFVYMPMMALTMATSTYVGQNIGAGKLYRVKKGIGVCMLITCILSITMGVLVFVFCKNLVGLFTQDADAQAYAIQMMHYLAPCAWIFSFSDILGGAIRGSGDTVKVTVITALCICLFRIVWLIPLLHFFNDIRIVFLRYPVSWVLCSMVMIIYFFKGSKLWKDIRAVHA